MPSASTAGAEFNAEFKPLDDESLGRLLHLIEALVITLTNDGQIKDCNSTCENVSGFSMAELVGRNFANTFAILQEVDLLREKVQVLADQGAIDRFETFLLTKLGDPKRIRWSGVRLDTPQESGQTLMFSGIDVTNEYEALLQLAKTEQETAQLQQKLTELSTKFNLREDEDIDRRAERRLYFPRRQRVAPCRNSAIPTEDRFFEVECRNIAARGIGFYLEGRPTHSEFVVELGSRSCAIFLTAVVRHSTLVRCDGRERYLIGCKFTGRITD